MSSEAKVWTSVAGVVVGSFSLGMNIQKGLQSSENEALIGEVSDVSAKCIYNAAASDEDNYNATFKTQSGKDVTCHATFKEGQDHPHLVLDGFE